jgi:hypothetical protein
MRIAYALFLFVAGCTDPVRDRQIEALGGEDPNVPVGPDHRPGQPCVLCHSEGGPASDKPFAVAGTIYETAAPNSRGADGIVVKFIDGRRGAPRTSPRTGPSGNFFVPESDWPELTYPFAVGLYRDGQLEPVQEMQTRVNREPSCNVCHVKSGAPPYSPDEASFNKTVFSQIYVRGGS